MSKPRVLINAISLTQQGGGRSYVRNLLGELNRDDRGLDFAVMAAPGSLSNDELGRFDLLEADPPGRGVVRTVTRVLYEEVVLPRLARRFDLLYCLADLSPAWGSVPTVVALRNFNIYDRRFYDTLRTRTLFRLVRLGLRRADRVVCPSRYAAQEIGSAVGLAPERIDVIHHGIAPEAFDGALEPVASARPYLFLPANLERHKNIPLLFDGLRELSDPELELWIAGGDTLDPEWAAHLRALAGQKGLAERVRFLGPVPYQEILRYHRGALALVFPSLLETFGHPLLEAMLAGTPVVAADIPAFHEIAGDAALYFPPDDAAALAGCIEALRSDPAAARARVESGRLRARDFTWDRAVDALCRVFLEVLARRPR